MHIKLEIDQFVDAVSSLPLADMQLILHELKSRCDRKAMAAFPMCRLTVEVSGEDNAVRLAKKITERYHDYVKGVTVHKQVSETMWEAVECDSETA